MEQASEQRSEKSGLGSFSVWAEMFSEKMKKKLEERQPGGMAALYRKELADHLDSRRFYIMFFLLVLVCAASVAGAIGVIRESGSGLDYLYLYLFTTSSGSLYSLNTFLVFLGPLIGIMLGFDLINAERSQGTLNRLAAQPIYRDSIINAKFLAGASIIFMLVYAVGLLVLGAGIISIGIPPETEEVLRILVYLFFAAVYICFWLGFSLLFSVLCRSTATTALICLAVWLFMSMFYPLVVSLLANLVFPMDGMEGIWNMMDNYEFQLMLNRCSPYYLFSEVSSTILNPNVRSVGMVTQAQLSGAVAGYLPLSQSLLLVWPHLTALVAMTICCFGISYVVFMKQELRA